MAVWMAALGALGTGQSQAATEDHKLSASDGAASDRFGISVSWSGDTAVIGARADDEGGSLSGGAYVFMRSDVVWIEKQKLTASDATAGDEFGESVSVAGGQPSSAPGKLTTAEALVLAVCMCSTWI